MQLTISGVVRDRTPTPVASPIPARFRCAQSSKSRSSPPTRTPRSPRFTALTDSHRTHRRRSGNALGAPVEWLLVAVLFAIFVLAVLSVRGNG